MHDQPCWLCGESPATIARTHTRRSKVSCPRCGEFSITFEATKACESYRARLGPRQKANCSGWLREHQGYEIYEEDLDRLFNLPTPSVQERADKLLKAIEKRIDVLGTGVTIHRQEPEDLELMAISYSVSPSELVYLTDQFLSLEKGYARAFTSSAARQFDVIVTAKGYAYLEELKRSSRDSVIGFCAMWFKPQLIRLWEEGIYPAIRASGYKPERIDRVEHNNKIDDEIIAMIRRSKFVIADFTGGRGGVYFEAGFARGLGKEVLWTVRSGRLHRIHFDNRQFNFIEWSFDNLAEFRSRLQNRIEATIGSGPLSPDVPA